MLAERSTIPAMCDAAIDRVRRAEETMRAMPQVDVPTAHLLHAGLYARTIRIRAGVMLTGVLVKIPTVLVVNGSVTVYTGDGPVRFDGYHVVAADAHRKQAFYAHADTDLTMLFATDAETVEAAEDAFTDEAHLLMTRSERGLT